MNKKILFLLLITFFLGCEKDEQKACEAKDAEVDGDDRAETCLEACEAKEDAEVDGDDGAEAETACESQKFADCEGMYDHVMVVPQGCACPSHYYNSGIGCLGIVDGCSVLEATGKSCLEAQREWGDIFYEKAVEGYLCWPY